MVSVLAFYSDNLSLNSAEAYNFYVKIVVEINENKEKSCRDWYILKRSQLTIQFLLGNLGVLVSLLNLV